MGEEVGGEEIGDGEGGGGSAPGCQGFLRLLEGREEREGREGGDEVKGEIMREKKKGEEKEKKDTIRTQRNKNLHLPHLPPHQPQKTKSESERITKIFNPAPYPSNSPYAGLLVSVNLPLGNSSQESPSCLGAEGAVGARC